MDDEELEVDEPGGEEKAEGCGDGNEAEVFRFFRFENDVDGEEDREVIDSAKNRNRNAHDLRVFAFCHQVATVGDGAGEGELGVVLDC